MHPDRLLDEYAARQYGVFSLTQARSVGLTPKMVETRLSSGAWVTLAPSVYAVASAPPRWERQVAAALLSRERAIATGRTAAVLHQFPSAKEGRPEIMIAPGGNARSPLARVVRSKYFDDVSRTRVRGFEVTDEAETIVVLARHLPTTRLEQLVDEVIARGSCSPGEISDLLARRPGLAGSRRLGAVIGARLETAYQPPTSELERVLYRLVDHPRGPPTTRQLPIQFENTTALVDLYIPSWRLIVEADGRRWHTRKADMERDRNRDNEATAHGLAVLRFTWTMLTSESANCLDVLIRTGEARRASQPRP